MTRKNIYWHKNSQEDNHMEQPLKGKYIYSFHIFPRVKLLITWHQISGPIESTVEGEGPIHNVINLRYGVSLIVKGACSASSFFFCFFFMFFIFKELFFQLVHNFMVLLKRVVILFSFQKQVLLQI